MASRLCFSLLLSLSVAACSWPPASSPPSSQAGEFAVTGLLLTPIQDGAISVAHDEITNYMPAMTMPFRLADPDEAAHLTPGDRVRFTLRVGPTSSEILNIHTIGQDLAALARYGRSGSPSARVKAGDSVPAFTLTDQHGQALSVATLRGHRTVLTFIFTRCPVPEFCPRISGLFRQLQRAIVADAALADVRLLCVTLDPAFDTPPVLEAYGQALGADFSRWRFATGRPEDIAALTRAFAVRTEAGAAGIDHTIATVVIDAESRVVTVRRDNQWRADEVLQELRTMK